MKHMSAGCWKGLHDLFDIQKRLGLRDVSALGDLSTDTLDHDCRIRENSFFGQAFHSKTARSEFPCRLDFRMSIADKFFVREPKMFHAGVCLLPDELMRSAGN